jgi:hypothetical protein
MPVLSASNRWIPIGNLRIGDTVCSIDSISGRLAVGTVIRADHLKAHHLVQFNDFLTFTPSHPVKTETGWLPAGEINLGSQIRLMSGKEVTIVSIENRDGSFDVVDLAIEPFHSFVVGGIVVHNKPME